MNDEIELRCVYCHQLLPEEDKIIYTHYGKTCSRLCSRTLTNVHGLEEEIKKLKIKFEAIADYLNDKIRKETGCQRVKIDFDK